MGALGYLRHAKRLVSKKGALPLYLVFFVTEQCQAGCKHCLLGGLDVQPDKELNLDEIDKIASTMDPLLFLLLTGGDPFLRPDIPEIVEIFSKHTQVANVGMPCNGTQPERIIPSVERILTNCPKIDFALDISLDGIGADHDKIRRIDGMFDKAVETYRGLDKLRKRFPKFNLNVAITVSYYNQDKVAELHRWVVDTLKPDHINHMLTRGRPRDMKALNVNINKYTDLSERIDQSVLDGEMSGYRDYPFADVVNAMKMLRNHMIEDTVKHNRFQSPCYAGTLSANIFSQGDLYPCELLHKPIGNLREVGYDFRTLWTSTEAEEIRHWIRDSKCFCTYECFLTNNIMFNPGIFPKVGVEYAKIKAHKTKKAIEKALGKMGVAPAPKEPSQGNPVTAGELGLGMEKHGGHV